MVKKFILIAVISAVILNCKRPATPPEVLYVTPKAGLWLRATASVEGNKVVLLPFSMSVLVEPDKVAPAIIDGKAGYWRRVKYGAFVGFAFDGYLAKNYFSLVSGSQHFPKDWMQKFSHFYEMPREKQISLINQLIAENNRIGDPLEGNNTFSMCMFGLEWRDCNGIMTLPSGPLYTSKDAFLKAIETHLRGPNLEFFRQNTRCVLHVGCMHCDGGFFMPKDVFINELMTLLGKIKIKSIKLSEFPMPKSSEPLLEIETAADTESVEKTLYVVISNDYGYWQISRVLGSFSGYIHQTKLARCYP